MAKATLCLLSGYFVFVLTVFSQGQPVIQYSHEYSCNKERIVVGHCRTDSDQPGFAPTKPENDYCQVYYPDRPKSGGFEAMGTVLRGDIVKTLTACGAVNVPAQPEAASGDDTSNELEKEITIASAIRQAGAAYQKADNETAGAKEFDLAVNKYKDIINRYPFSSYPKVKDAYTGLALTLMNGQHKYDLALEVWLKLRKLTPDDPAVAILLGQTQYHLKHYEDSLKAFQDALALGPDAEMQAIAHVSIGYIYRDQNQFDKARVENLDALRAYPGYSDATHALGVSYYGLNNYPKAIETFQQAIQQKYSPIERPYNWIGYIYNELKEYDKALPYLLEIKKIDPEYPDTAANLGRTYTGLKRNADAIAAFKEAVRLDPKVGKRYYDLGHAYVQFAQKDKAMEAYNSLLAIDKASAQNLLNEINKPMK